MTSCGAITISALRRCEKAAENKNLIEDCEILDKSLESEVHKVRNHPLH